MRRLPQSWKVLGMREKDRTNFERASSLSLCLLLLVACLATVVLVRQASDAFGSVRGRTDVLGCQISRDAVTGQEVRTGC
jgi:hypothetical protein